MAHRGHLPRSFYGCGKWIDRFIPFEQSSFPRVPRRQVMTLVPTHPSLVLGIMNCEYSRNIAEMFESITLRHHKRNEGCMMIVEVNYVRLVLPAAQPICESDLERNEAFRVVV